MTKISNGRIYDLEARTFKFARSAMNYANGLGKSLSNVEVARQLIRSSGSVGANYIEVNESLSRKDFVMRVKISRKEAKESRYWLQLSEPHSEFIAEKERLVQEAMELMKIFGAILQKCK